MKTVTKLFVLFASTILCASAWAQVSSIAVGSGSGLPGATGIVVPVSLTANGDNIAGIDMRVTFTTASQYSAITVDCSAQTVSGNVFPSCSVAGNVVTIQLAETAANPWVSGLLANITVDIDGAATPLVDDPLVALVVGASDNTGTDITFPTTTDGTFTVLAGPQPDWSSTPNSATGFNFGSNTQDTGAYPLDLVVTNTGADGSTLTGDCAITADPGGVFGFVGDNTLGSGLAANASGTITVQCDTTGVLNSLYNGTMSCTHNGDGTTETSVTDYGLSCNVTAAPEPFYTDSLSPDPMDLVAVEEGDTNPLGTLQVLNVGGDANMNVTCSYSGDSQISTTLDGTPVLIGIDSLVEIQVGCDATNEGLYSGSISCAHDASNVASPVVYPATCDVGPPGDAVYESNPAPGSTIDMTPPLSPVIEGSVIPTQDLVITNNPPELDDRELNLLNCNLIGMSPISATVATTPLAPGDSTTVTFSCDSSTAGDFSDTYACSYDVDGDSTEDGVANYTVNCGVREPESDVTQTPPAGSTLTIVVTPLGTASRSIFFAESADEGEDGTLVSCSLADTTYFSIIEPSSFPAVIPSGTTIPVNIEATGPEDGEATTTLTCTYSDSDGTDVVDWTLLIVTRYEPIPTLSEWGMALMILTLLGLGGIVIRRRVVI